MFRAEASPFMLGETMQYHFDQQPANFQTTIELLRENTYVDNLMEMGSDVLGQKKSKEEATEVLEK